jgi:hypothetical protein
MKLHVGRQVYELDPEELVLPAEGVGPCVERVEVHRDPMNAERALGTVRMLDGRALTRDMVAAGEARGEVYVLMKTWVRGWIHKPGESPPGMH